MGEWVGGGVLMSQDMRDHHPFLLAQVRWRLAAAFPHPHSLSPVFIGEHMNE